MMSTISENKKRVFTLDGNMYDSHTETYILAIRTLSECHIQKCPALGLRFKPVAQALCVIDNHTTLIIARHQRYLSITTILQTNAAIRRVFLFVGDRRSYRKRV